ncbi:thioredoxin family protein [Campylobacter sp. 19-13652]|uniref:TlpA family protein disulfide reductase n=1 Tax=Campylobacter sp. 19-13652 TaxID=2840180 RepID=UPI001C79678A|nr:thioredoxin family protein [Campylobacter sp. 19-13652]BCX79634.1 hypothetical protein LBC_10960 [Campylobacter sp. 19-13652]
MKRLLACAMLAFFITGCSGEKESGEETKIQAQNQEAEVEITEFKLSNLSNSTIDVSTINGGLKLSENKASVIIFVTPNCAPCKTELSYIYTIAQKYKSDAKIMLAILGASDDEIKELSDEFNLADEVVTKAQDLAKALNINALPAIIISDKNGNKIRSYVGLAPVEMLESDINLAVLR